MAEFVPVALACGHLIEGVGHYEIPAVGSPETARVECPEGCGWVTFVVEPHEGQLMCLCQPGHHVCGEAATVIVDLDEDPGDQDPDTYPPRW